MAVYKVLTEMYDADGETMFKKEWSEVCADHFHIRNEETLVFVSKDHVNVAAFSYGSWRRVKKVENCECECE